MSIVQLRKYHRNYLNNVTPPSPQVNTMEIQKEIAKKNPQTVQEKQKIILGEKTKNIPVNSVDEIIKSKPSVAKVRQFFKNRVNEINEELEDNF